MLLIFRNNPASGKVLQKNGFEFEGILKQEVLKMVNFRFTLDMLFFKTNI